MEQLPKSTLQITANGFAGFDKNQFAMTENQV